MPNIKPLTNESDIVPDADTSEPVVAPTSAVEQPVTNTKFVNDVQLPPMGQRSKAKIAIDTPDQVGFISRFPPRAYVLSWFYVAMTPLYVLMTYIAVTAEQAKVVDSKESANLLTQAVLEPSVALIACWFMVLALLGGSKIIRWMGLLVNVAALGYQGKTLVANLVESSKTIQPDTKLMDAFDSYVRVIIPQQKWIIASVLILVFTLVYIISPQHKADYK